MFTGIIESVGKILSKQPHGQGVELKIDTGLDLSGDAIGDSVAVDGVCLTITKMKGSVFSAHASAETITRSTLGDIRPGAKVNIERALTLSSQARRAYCPRPCGYGGQDPPERPCRRVNSNQGGLRAGICKVCDREGVNSHRRRFAHH